MVTRQLAGAARERRPVRAGAAGALPRQLSSMVRRRRRWPWVVVGVLAVGLVTVAALPALLRAGIVHALEADHAYVAKLERVQLERSGVRLVGLEVTAREDGAAVAQVPELAVRWSWRSLVAGPVRLQLSLTRPELSLRQKAGGRRGEGQAWRERLARARPLVVERLDVQGGTVRLPGKVLRQPVVLRDLVVEATGLSNRPGPAGELPARVEATARVGQAGRVALDLRAAPMEVPVAASLSLEGTALPVPPALEALEQQLGGKAGAATLALEATVRDGSYDGHVALAVAGPEAPPGQGGVLGLLHGRLGKLGTRALGEAGSRVAERSAHFSGKVPADASPTQVLAQVLAEALSRLAPG